MSSDLSYLPRVDVSALPLYNEYARSCRGYVGLKLLSDNSMDSEDPSEWPEYLLEINPNISDDQNYALKLTVVSNDGDETYSCDLANSVVKLVGDDVLQFQALYEEPFLVRCETHAMARYWVQTICVVSNIANQRNKVMKQQQEQMEHITQSLLKNVTSMPVETILGPSPALVNIAQTAITESVEVTAPPQSTSETNDKEKTKPEQEPHSVDVKGSAKGLQSPRTVVILPEQVDPPLASPPSDSLVKCTSKDIFPRDAQFSSPLVEEPPSDDLDDYDDRSPSDTSSEDVEEVQWEEDWDESDTQQQEAIQSAESMGASEVSGPRSAQHSVFILIMLLTVTYVVAALCHGLAGALKAMVFWPLGRAIGGVVDFGRGYLFRKGWYTNLTK
jgi:hypothetical protein